MTNKQDMPPNLIQLILSRFVDIRRPVGSTNITTALGASLMSLALALSQQPDMIMQGTGFVIGTVGFIMTLYKGKNQPE